MGYDPIELLSESHTLMKSQFDNNDFLKSVNDYLAGGVNWVGNQPLNAILGGMEPQTIPKELLVFGGFEGGKK